MQLAIVLLLLFSVTTCYADSHHNYEEVRLHVKKVEARLKDWSARTKEHAKVLETSDNPKLVRWRHQMAEISFTKELEELGKLNSIINGDVTYRDDYSHFHKKDYWADPEITLEEGGDCEDIALLKSASLHRLGWPEHRMHLLMGYLIERGKKEAHAVLMVELESGEQYVLRSITNQVVHPDNYGFLPVYAVDNEGTLIVKLKHPKKT